ncbi:MAG: 50S ribosomal protein L6 [Sphingobacteriaceae bacterium]|nr:50S ribosomal protein L6 [Sphingobacteriaceae bacterium]
MSRIGKLPVVVPAGVNVTVSDKNVVTVTGPKGQLDRAVDSDIQVVVEEGQVVVQRPTDSKRHKALHGLYRSLINNMVKGVSEGFKLQQELVGVGYRANANGQLLELALGYSHDIVLQIPAEVKLITETLKGKNPVITLESIDKELIGQVAAKIRSLRKPEPYKGKGVRFVGEVLRRKAGKSASKK